MVEAAGLCLFLWALVVLGLIADAIDRWSGGPDQRESRSRNHGRRW